MSAFFDVILRKDNKILTKVYLFSLVYTRKAVPLSRKERRHISVVRSDMGNAGERPKRNNTTVNS